MFELLSDVNSVPVDRDLLKAVHHGMNKVRISVGEHISEPSEVFILTGEVNGHLETYIIFYMLQPGIHVVYGFDRNPYSPDNKEQVLQEATEFVEEMGSILEEVPLDNMTPEQRTAWFEAELLFGENLIEGLEELEEITELEEVEPEEDISGETGHPEGSGPNMGEEVVEISEEEVLEIGLYGDAEPEYPDALENGEGPDAAGEKDGESEEVRVDSAAAEDVVVAEGDFDELLKQAFLKPDIVEKTRKKSAMPKDPETEDVAEVPDPSEVPTDTHAMESADRDAAQDSTADLQVTAEGENDPGHGIHPEDVEVLHGPAEDGPGQYHKTSPEGETGLKIIRFLSRF